jgi:hypothetical protein
MTEQFGRSIEMVKRIPYNRLFLAVTLAISIYVFTPSGKAHRVELAKIAVVTRYQNYAWVLVGKAKGEQMILEHKKHGIPLNQTAL